MYKPVFTVNAEEGQLNEAQLHKIRLFLQKGGLCLLPSDSAYILTGILTDQVSSDLNSLLERGNLKISLSFGSVEQIMERMELSETAYEFIQELMPGGLTFIANPRNLMMQQFSQKYLYADGTIGVRVTDSLIERQIAEYMDTCLPTTPVRTHDSHGIIDSEEALDFITGEMERLRIDRPFAFIKGNVPFPERWSTIVKEINTGGRKTLHILREGALSYDTIELYATECGYDRVTQKTP